MKSTLIIALSLMVSCVSYAGEPCSRENVATLRSHGALNVTSEAPVYKQWAGKTPNIERTFAEQPPLIPHKSQSQKINLKVNKCLSCHGPENYEKKKATKIGESHFKGRDGKLLTNISATRYFCNQCHVEQRDVKPLVINDFKASKPAE